MPPDSAHAPQLPLFICDTVGYPEAFTRYEAIRPVLKGERHCQVNGQSCRTKVLSGTPRSFRGRFVTLGGTSEP